MNGRCIVCNQKLYEKPLFFFNNIPERVQNLPLKEDLENDTGIDLGLFQCSGCGLIQFDCEPVEYYKDSTRAGERCKSLIDLRRREYKHFIETYKLQGKKFVEIGAGKGGFLRTLKEMKEYHIEEFGIENNAEFVDFAREENHVNVIQGFLDRDDVVIPGGPFDAFTCFSYPARLINPNIVLRAIAGNLKDNGIGYISTVSQEHIFKRDGAYEISRDSYAYYSVETISFLARYNGFEVLEVGNDDPYVYAIIRKRLPPDMKKIWAQVDVLNKEIRGFINQEVRQNRKVAVWCAGHYAFTIISMTEIGNEIAYIVDNAPFKQGHFAPASHVPIVAPDHFEEEPVDTCLILGRNLYADEIINELQEKCYTVSKVAMVNEEGIVRIR